MLATFLLHSSWKPIESARTVVRDVTAQQQILATMPQEQRQQFMTALTTVREELGVQGPIHSVEEFFTILRGIETWRNSNASQLQNWVNQQACVTNTFLGSFSRFMSDAEQNGRGNLENLIPAVETFKRESQRIAKKGGVNFKKWASAYQYAFQHLNEKHALQRFLKLLWADMDILRNAISAYLPSIHGIITHPLYGPIISQVETGGVIQTITSELAAMDWDEDAEATTVAIWIVKYIFDFNDSELLKFFSPIVGLDASDETPFKQALRRANTLNKQTTLALLERIMDQAGAGQEDYGQRPPNDLAVPEWQMRLAQERSAIGWRSEERFNQTSPIPNRASEPRWLENAPSSMASAAGGSSYPDVNRRSQFMPPWRSENIPAGPQPYGYSALSRSNYNYPENRMFTSSERNPAFSSSTATPIPSAAPRSGRNVTGGDVFSQQGITQNPSLPAQPYPSSGRYNTNDDKEDLGLFF